jgi:hypothetical protein
MRLALAQKSLDHRSFVSAGLFPEMLMHLSVNEPSYFSVMEAQDPLRCICTEVRLEVLHCLGSKIVQQVCMIIIRRRRNP